MRLERFLAALAIVLGFIGAAYLWTRPGVRIDETVVLDGKPLTPRSAHGSLDAGPPVR